MTCMRQTNHQRDRHRGHGTSSSPPFPSGPSPPVELAAGDDGLLVALRDERTVAAALALVYQQHVPAVRAHLCGIGLDADLADDVVQEAVIQLWQRRATLPDGLAIGAWLAMVAGRRAVDALRRGWRRHPPLAAQRHAGLLVGEDLAAVAVRCERRHQVHQLLAALDPDERRLVYLTYWHGYRQEQLAVLLNVSPAALASWAFRVRRYLATAWLALEAGRRPPPRRRLARRGIAGEPGQA